VPSYNNDGRVANPRTGNTFFEVADLDTDVFFAIEKLEPGDVTQPISFRGPDGTRYFRLVQLVSRSKPHRADLKQDYNKIQAAALEQKKAGYVDQWMREKLRSTYLAIDPLFRDCPDLQALLQEADDPNRP
jgi:peptidyl-prolyl cis-trans isomerase SurA